MLGITPTRYGWQFLKPKHYVKANQVPPQGNPRILLNRKWLCDTAIQSPPLIRNLTAPF